MTGKKFIMLVGPPGSGKSTWVDNQKSIGWGYGLNIIYNNIVILSTDKTIEMVAKECNLSYNDVFQDNMKFAEAVLKQELNEAIKNGRDIIWDQTNLTIKSRAKKLALIPNDYRKVALVFSVPREELFRRCAQRPGKVIPDNILIQMIESYQQPTISEGFDRVEIYKQ